MGNQWARIYQENTATFADHTEYTTPNLEFDYVDLDPDLDMGNQIVHTSGYSMKRRHWLNALGGRLRINNYAAGDNIGEFLKSIFGDYSLTFNDPATRHKFEPLDAGTAWTLYDYDDDLTNYRKFQGLQATRFEINAPARDVASVVWEAIYADEAQAAMGATTMGSLPSVRPFVFHDGSVSFEAAQAFAESFRVVIARDVPEDTHVQGHRDRQYMINEGYTVTVECDLQLDSWINLRRYYGDSAGTAPADEDELVAGSFVLDGPLTGDAGEYDQYKLLFNFPEMIITGHKTTKTRRDRKVERVTLEAIYNASNYIYLYNLKGTYVAA